jgi:hypothetical protein
MLVLLRHAGGMPEAKQEASVQFLNGGLLARNSGSFSYGATSPRTVGSHILS